MVSTCVWKDEGEVATEFVPPLVRDSEMLARELVGSGTQVEWAQRIRRRVGAEVDRVEAPFRSVAQRQAENWRADTEVVIAILEEKRVAVLNQGLAGYLIRKWQFRDQVWQ